MKKQSKHYINNRQLYDILVKYKKDFNLASGQNLEHPKIPNYIGQAIYQICSKLIIRPNFFSYTSQWKQEMVSDAMIDCVSAINNFDPEKTNNPFAYFTQIAWNAFIRRIQKEKKQQYIKLKNFEKIILSENCSEEEITHFNTNESFNEFIKIYEEKNSSIDKTLKK
jgi:DNA-directed RNA polymerase specialized sigma24 family protein